MADYYEILGVAKAASEADIKLAYKKLAQKYHPDRYEGDDAKTKFQEINSAYQTLSDPDKRAAYDNPQPEGYYTYSGTGNQSHSAIIDELLRQMGEQGLGRRGYGRQQQYQMVNVRISLEEAFSGTTRTLNNKQFTIPAGVRSGNQLLIDDFVIVINVMGHNKFRRSHDDLLTVVQISAVEAMLGIECRITNIDGKIIKVKIPAGIQHGKLVRAAGVGMPNPEIDKRGDLLVQVAVSTPGNLTDEEIESIMKVQHRKTFDA